MLKNFSISDGITYKLKIIVKQLQDQNMGLEAGKIKTHKL